MGLTISTELESEYREQIDKFFDRITHNNFRNLDQKVLNYFVNHPDDFKAECENKKVDYDYLYPIIHILGFSQSCECEKCSYVIVGSDLTTTSKSVCI